MGGGLPPMAVGQRQQRWLTHRIGGKPPPTGSRPLRYIATHLAFEIDGTHRNVAQGICRMLEGVQLMVDKVLDEACPAT
ncbi:hypothetical protein [Pseudomonas sp. 34 E 7]|nr:hypothetical protein [Pseudomonas sp. 34 E 7]